MLSLAVAMGVGRFAFTPLFPLMVRDGWLGNEAGSLLAGSNYLGYLVGALLAARLRLKPAHLLALGITLTVCVTAAMGWSTSLSAWLPLRFAAGVMSAWALVATSAWGLGWLATLGRPQLAGVIFAGVGLGISATGLFCLIAPGPERTTLELWVALGGLSGLAILLPLAVALGLNPPAPSAGTAAAAQPLPAPGGRHGHGGNTRGLILCYTLFGFGYILPATYLPALARQLVDDPRVFGLAWPLFGLAAGLSTLLAAWALRRIKRLRLWAGSQFVLALGVFLPVAHPSLASIAAAALLVGGTFMVITMVAMQEARARAEEKATLVLGQMTAGFAFGQLLGPVASAALERLTGNFSTALAYALALSAAGLFFSALYLWREAQRPLHPEE